MGHMLIVLKTTSTWHRKNSKQSGIVAIDSCFALFVVTPYWRAPKRAKQLSMATIPLCFEFFQCRVDVLQSQFSRSTINMSTFHFCWSGLYRSYVLRHIFVCGPLQSFVVNVCTMGHDWKKLCQFFPFCCHVSSTTSSFQKYHRIEFLNVCIIPEFFFFWDQRNHYPTVRDF